MVDVQRKCTKSGGHFTVSPQSAWLSRSSAISIKAKPIEQRQSANLPWNSCSPSHNLRLLFRSRWVEFHINKDQSVGRSRRKVIMSMSNQGLYSSIVKVLWRCSNMVQREKLVTCNSKNLRSSRVHGFIVIPIHSQWRGLGINCKNECCKPVLFMRRLIFRGFFIWLLRFNFNFNFVIRLVKFTHNLTIFYNWYWFIMESMLRESVAHGHERDFITQKVPKGSEKPALANWYIDSLSPHL